MHVNMSGQDHIIGYVTGNEYSWNGLTPVAGELYYLSLFADESLRMQ